MKNGWGRNTTIVGTIGATVLLGAVSSYAQSLTGAQVTFDFSSEIEIDDNEALDSTSLGTTTTFDNALGVSILSETQTSSIEFTGRTVLRYENDPTSGSDTRFDDNAVGVAYQTEGASSQFRTSFDYQEVQVDDEFLADTDGDLISDELVIDSGERRRSQFAIGLTNGVGGPFQTDVSLRAVDVNFVDTMDANLFDFRRYTADARARAQFSPVVTGIARLSFEDFEGEDTDQTERRTYEASVGAELAVDPVSLVTVEVGYTSIDEDTTAGPDDINGFTGALRYARDLANGTAGARLTRDITQESERTELVFDRSIELPAGQLSFEVGASDSSTGPVSAVGSIRYSQELPSAVISIAATRTATTTDDSDEILTTRLNASYVREISPVMAFDVAVGLAQTEDIGSGTADETTRADIELAIRRALTDDWDLRAGYRGRYSDSTANPDARSNAVFATVSRTFALRP